MRESTLHWDGSPQASTKPNIKNTFLSLDVLELFQGNYKIKSNVSFFLIKKDTFVNRFLMYNGKRSLKWINDLVVFNRLGLK